MGLPEHARPDAHPVEPDGAPLMQSGDMERQLLAFARDLNRIYHEERARSQQLESALRELEDSYFQTVKAFAFVVEAKDPHTRSHLSRAHEYAVALAGRISPELADDKIFGYGFLLHDIGKMGIPDHILRKPSPLTAAEWEVMQMHPIIGAQILAPIKFLQRAIPIVESHHERWDGEGYPRGLKGEQIPLAARIFSVVDTFDAITSDRPYRKALSVEQAVEEMEKHAGAQHDPEVVREFVALCRESTEHWPLRETHHPVDRTSLFSVPAVGTDANGIPVVRSVDPHSH